MQSEHPGSRDTYNTIAQWIHPEFPYSSRDKWDRYGFIGMFAYYVLSCTPGDVLEIGVGESSIYLTQAIKNHNRRIWHCDISPSKIVNPMTIPGYLSDNPTYLEERDPDPAQLNRCVCYAGSSDSLFQRFEIKEIAVSFIDGDHRYEQAKKDFDNVFQRTVENGYILLHDTYPPDYDWIDENHCGDVYKLRQEIEARKDVDCLTLTRGTAIGVGLTIIRKRPKGYMFQ